MRLADRASELVGRRRVATRSCLRPRLFGLSKCVRAPQNATHGRRARGYAFLRLCRPPRLKPWGVFWPDRLEIVVTFATDWRGAWVGGHPMRDTHWSTARV